jgi:gluconokinase
MTTYPKSPKEMTRGMIYFPRMLDKIRLHASGELHEDYHKNFGTSRTADSACCNFLRVHHRDLRERVAAPTKKFWSGVLEKAGGSMQGIF